MKAVFAALLPQLETVRHEVTSDMQDQLRRELAPLGELRTTILLQNWRAFALDLVKDGTARQRKKKVEQLPPEKRHLAHYAAAAWLARALVLAQHMEQADLPMMPKKWAGNAMLGVVGDFESDEDWLWPFDSPSPWPDEDEKDDGD